MLTVIIPVHPSEDTTTFLATINGVKRTICTDDFRIISVGILPKGIFVAHHTPPNWQHIKSDLMLGDAKNLGANVAIENYNPDALVFMDAHMNFFDKQSNNWGNTISKHLKTYPQSIISPAISIYDDPNQRSFGVINEITEDEQSMDLKWKWWGQPNANNEPFEVPGLCGCFMAMTSATFENSICGFTPPLCIDDREFSMRMWTLGFQFYSIPSLTIGHRFASKYADFTKEKSIEWGMGMLLFTYLNMNVEITKRLFEKGINASQDKEESLRRATAPQWESIREIIQKSRVRTHEDYIKTFLNKKEGSIKH